MAGTGSASHDTCTKHATLCSSRGWGTPAHVPRPPRAHGADPSHPSSCGAWPWPLSHPAYSLAGGLPSTAFARVRAEPRQAESFRAPGLVVFLCPPSARPRAWHPEVGQSAFVPSTRIPPAHRSSPYPMVSRLDCWHGYAPWCGFGVVDFLSFVWFWCYVGGTFWACRVLVNFFCNLGKERIQPSPLGTRGSDTARKWWPRRCVPGRRVSAGRGRGRQVPLAWASSLQFPFAG